MNDLARQLHQSQEKLARDMHGLIADAEELLRHAARDAGAEFTHARERLEQGLKGARARLATTEESVRVQAGAADDYVQRNAWAAIGAGAGVGFLAGLLLARR